jgi:hypothetical protein
MWLNLCRLDDCSALWPARVLKQSPTKLIESYQISFRGAVMSFDPNKLYMKEIDGDDAIPFGQLVPRVSIIVNLQFEALLNKFCQTDRTLHRLKFSLRTSFISPFQITVVNE